MSLYIRDFDAAVAFYSNVFGPPESVNEQRTIVGWRMGSTWFTVFPGHTGTAQTLTRAILSLPIQVASPAQVDALCTALIAAGAPICMPPADTRMYEPMRYAWVDDPFGVRIDVYHNLQWWAG